MDDEFDSITQELSLMKLMGLPTEFSTSKKGEGRVNKRIKRDRRTMDGYKAQRYLLFSRYDEGIELDDESWYSVTPEQIAAHIASRCMIEGTCTILDAFCGAGGSAIQFALASPHVHVIAIDINPARVKMAQNNAKVYQVDDRIHFIVGDFMQIAESGLKCDVVFLSPPWGGPSYMDVDKYPLSKMTPDGNQVFQMAQRVSHNIAFYVPKNIDQEELIKLAGVGGSVEIEKNYIQRSTKVRKCKAITAYYGDLLSATSEN